MGSLLQAPFLSLPRFLWKQPPVAETLACYHRLLPAGPRPRSLPLHRVNRVTLPTPHRVAPFLTASGFPGLSERETESSAAAPLPSP